MREWEAFFPEQERKIYEKAGYKGKQPFGVNPALLIIDVIIGFTGTRPMPVMEAIEEFPTSCGEAAWQALPKIRELLHACRGAGVPVVYSTSDPDFKAAFGNATKRGVDRTDFERRAMEFPEMIRPRDGEFIVRKARASAFFGTHLITYLVRKNVDCLLVTGTSTCGCVRGTVLDGYSFGYPVFVVEECVFDRSRTSHLVNLFEMNAKYASVIQLAEALDYVHRLERTEGRRAVAG
ncbi:MAG TPA: isochorismatase family protein [candidate division Zixibacteria bacterium]|nr:isochorismatase family protein [candidate division Zixibacteria bacterium]